MKKQVFVLAILLFSHLCLVAQSLIRDDNSLKEDSIISDYLRKAGNQSVIYSGKMASSILLNRAIPYLKPRSEEKNATDPSYFIKGEKTSYTTGQLFFDDIVYPDITMRLDLMNNELVVLAPDKTGMIVLDPLRLKYADLFGYRLFFLIPDRSNKLPTEGYYMQFYGGKYSLYKRYTYPSFVASIQNVKQTITYYIYVDGKFHKINNKGSLLKVLKTNKEELEQFIKDNKLNFSKDKDESFALVVQYYEKLNEE